jgi:hypothetical protein
LVKYTINYESLSVTVQIWSKGVSVNSVTSANG